MRKNTIKNYNYVWACLNNLISILVIDCYAFKIIIVIYIYREIQNVVFIYINVSFYFFLLLPSVNV